MGIRTVHHTMAVQAWMYSICVSFFVSASLKLRATRKALKNGLIQDWHEGLLSTGLYCFATSSSGETFDSLSSPFRENPQSGDINASIGTDNLCLSVPLFNSLGLSVSADVCLCLLYLSMSVYVFLYLSVCLCAC